MNRLLKTVGYPAILLATIVASTGCAAQVAAVQQNAAQAQQESTATAAPVAANAAGLMDLTKANEQAPTRFVALVKTTQGDFKVEVRRVWAPNGADRFYNMIRTGYFNSDIAIFRAIEGFMFQFGIHGDPAVAALWSKSTIMDDPANGISNLPGTLTFAQTGVKNSRSVQMFVNLGQNSPLDGPQGRDKTGTPFVPFGKIIGGIDVPGKINTEYGENPRGENVQGKFKANGNAYILKRFPNLDLIKSVTIIEAEK